MVTTANNIGKIKELVFESVTGFARWLTKPHDSIEANERLRIRLLATLLLFLTIVYLGMGYYLKLHGGPAGVIVMSLASLSLLGYWLTRTRYFPVSVVLTVSLPVIPPIVTTIFSTPGIDLPVELMWLALPLLAAGLMLNLARTNLIALVYIILVVALALNGSMNGWMLVMLIVYFVIISFIMISFAALRERGLSNIRKELEERQRITNVLTESEQKFIKVFNASPQSIIITRLKDTVTLDVNEGYVRNTGRSREETIGHSANAINVWKNPDDAQKMLQILEKTGRVYNEEFDFVYKDGTVGTNLLSVERLNIGGEDCILSILTDITERKQTENALRYSEDKFHRAFQAIPESVIITRIRDGMVIDANEQFFRFGKRRREETIGRTADELGLWKDKDERQKTIQEIYRHGSIINREVSVPGKEGPVTVLISRDIVNIGGEPCLISISNDITDIKRIEQALRESEEKFSKAFRYLPEAIAISRVKDGVFLDVNESFLKAKGDYTREQIIGHTAVELNFNDLPGDRDATIQLIKQQGKISKQEYSYHEANGEMQTAWLSADIVDIGDEPYMVTISTNITERKNMEEKLKRALVALEMSTTHLKAANKELESFSYSVSHDLRSPLRSIDGFSQALLEDYAPQLDETAKDYLNRMRKASQKMGELIDGLLKLSRLARGEMHNQTVNLSILAQEITSRLEETRPERKVDVVIAKDLTATGDPDMLRALMENLLGNAWKFTGKVQNAIIEFGSIANGGKPTFFVKDNGAGFNMDYKDKLFGAFQRLHQSTDFPGTGIGLATVQRIINRHGGTIRAEGVEGQGATFYFTLS